MCVVSKSSSWVLCPAAGRCMRPHGLRSSYVSASILWAARQKNNLMKLQVLAGRLFHWESLTPGNPTAAPPTGLTLLWYPERFRVSGHDLMHDSTELIQHLQALLLPHAGVVESWESWLEPRQRVRSQQQQAEQLGPRAFVMMLCFCYLCGLGEDELGVLYQTLQRHRHINDPCPLVPSAVVRHELAVPGVEDDEAWFLRSSSRRIK